MVITMDNAKGCAHKERCFAPDAADPLGMVHAANKLSVEREHSRALAGQLRMATTEILRLRGHDREASALEAKVLRSNPEAVKWVEQMEKDIATALTVGQSITRARVIEEEDSHGL